MAFSFSLQNETDSSTPTARTNSPFELLYLTKEATKLCMDLEATGDGLAAHGTGGTDVLTFGSNIAGAGNMCNGGAWVLFNDKAGVWQQLWVRPVGTSHTCNTYLSPSGSYTGGNATTPPTAVDEQQIHGSNQAHMVRPASAYPSMVHAIYGDVDEGYSFIVFNHYQSLMVGLNGSETIAMGGLFYDAPTAVHDGPMALRGVWGGGYDGWFNFNRLNFDNRCRAEDIDISNNQSPWAWTEGLSNPVREVGFACPCTDEEQGMASYFNDWEDEIDDIGPAMYFCSPFRGFHGKRRYLGRSRLFHVTSEPTNQGPWGGTFCFEQDLSRIYLGGVSIPWDGSTDLLI